MLDGSNGNTIIMGGSGDTTFIGGNGDLLFGGDGHNQFVFHAGSGANTINGFHLTDTLQFDAASFSSVTDILAHARDIGGNVMISGANGDSVTIVGVSYADLQQHPQDLQLASASA